MEQWNIRERSKQFLKDRVHLLTKCTFVSLESPLTSVSECNPQFPVTLLSSPCHPAMAVGEVVQHHQVPLHLRLRRSGAPWINLCLDSNSKPTIFKISVHDDEAPLRLLVEI